MRPNPHRLTIIREAFLICAGEVKWSYSESRGPHSKGPQSSTVQSALHTALFTSMCSLLYDCSLPIVYGFFVLFINEGNLYFEVAIYFQRRIQYIIHYTITLSLIVLSLNRLKFFLLGR